MDAIDRDEKLSRLKHLITIRTVGSATQLAENLAISRATLFRFINHLKIREGKEIKYSKIHKCFYFEES